MHRVIDVFASLLGLVLLCPVLVICAVVVLADSGRPIFYTQLRVGRAHQTFRLRKFRTMRTAPDGAAITAAGDRRITRAGHILRKYKLDELPQLWNVLWGEMSLVGPRPEVPGYVDGDDPRWRVVLAVRPGLTDLATLVYRHEENILASVEDPDSYYRRTILPAKLDLSIRYLRSHSLLSDARLVWMTAKYSLYPRRFDPQRVRQALLEE